ncbi:PAS domain-containing protein [Aliiroseovarius halocynthiae]|uniref:PAS domain-containing protein n=1 Tax=Aliiroseovarius halocynthiae TaxID=985055 RepID=A0A545SW17_9RHOB|nr:PAS domain-containing protein [Aliiroseovarius halocynthiae]TQV69162.1 PAS domain-containing protein [Aliiroseovarius halocynthiae]SMR71922.1 PAS domain-containing protein [Aliiroseovarius halocynthiae]
MNKDQSDPFWDQAVGNTVMKIEYLRNGNVVSLSSARHSTSFPAISLVEAYWHGLRNGRLCPTRHEVDPRGMAGALHEAFILEKIAPGLARIRLAGQHLNDILDMEVRGMPISVFFQTEARKELHRALEALFDMPAQVTLSLRTEAGAFRKTRDAQMVMLPLRDEDGQITRVLGALQMDGDVKRGPQRFSIQSVEVTPIVADADVTPSMSLTQKAYDEGQSAVKRTSEKLDVRLSTTPNPSSGHVFRDTNAAGDDAFHAFAEARRHFDLREDTETSEHERTSQRTYLRLVTSD